MVEFGHPKVDVGQPGSLNDISQLQFMLKGMASLVNELVLEHKLWMKK